MMRQGGEVFGAYYAAIVEAHTWILVPWTFQVFAAAVFEENLTFEGPGKVYKSIASIDKHTVLFRGKHLVLVLIMVRIYHPLS